MDWVSIFVVIFGLGLFEIISSIDNAIINAEVLSTMSKKYRRWFLIWGILIAVFVVRGFLPWVIVWATAPELGFIGSFTATFSNDPKITEIIESSAPILMIGGGIFLVFLFFHWLFLETKNFGLIGEKFFHRHGVWFYAIVSVILTYVVWKALHTDNPILAFGAVVGSSVFFITHGFKESAEKAEQNLMQTGMSDIAKILYLEVIDATFSIDGVLGAFAFTMSIPLILIGNGLGAIVVRQITVSNVERIKKYLFLKNGAMYSIFFLGLFMTLKGFGIEIPEYIAPLFTTIIVAYFFLKSSKAIKNQALTDAKKIIDL
ncbi:DUF475 domain-containing protein [Candidatus Gracilibacteria bacterium]|nr:DUF475 domain-containing protein [Candidatus Gracilibacteria bacterium]NUJ98982.1 DUF475 domain-containing protein [Candidatus Gracilibacteria bacterium]